MISLQDRCKNIVFENFDRYHEVYTTVTSSRDKLKYVFLQRKYSNELIKKLDAERKLNDPNSKYFDFVINRYLKTLDTDYLEEIEWDLIRKKFSEIGPNLEKVSFDNRPWEEVICHLGNLLNVTFYNCTVSLIRAIVQFCPKIQSIEMYSATMSPDDLEVLSCQADGTYACPELREIIFGGNNIEELIVYALQNLTMLEHIKYEDLPQVLYSNHIDNIHSLNNIKPYYNLTKLRLMDEYHFSSRGVCNGRRRVDDLLKICISVCPNIKSLECRVFTEEHLTLISKFEKLQELLLKNEGRCLDIDNFLKLKGNMLISLKVSSIHFSPTILFSNCSQLKILKMNTVIWPRSEKCSGFPIIGNLKELSITKIMSYHQSLPRQVASFLSSFPNLERLELDGFIYIPEIQAVILGAVKLRYVRFGEYVSSEFLADILSTCTSLTTLNLKKTKLTDADGGIWRVRSIEELRHIAGTVINQPVILDSPLYWTRRSDSEIEDEDDSEDEEKDLECYNDGYGSDSYEYY